MKWWNEVTGRFSPAPSALPIISVLSAPTSDTSGVMAIVQCEGCPNTMTIRQTIEQEKKTNIEAFCGSGKEEMK